MSLPSPGIKSGECSKSSVQASVHAYRILARYWLQVSSDDWGGSWISAGIGIGRNDGGGGDVATYN